MRLSWARDEGRLIHPFSGRGHRGRLTPRASTDGEATATVSACAQHAAAWKNVFGAGVGRRQADSENGSIGHLEPGRGPDEAPMGGATRQSPRNSIPTGTGCACRDEAGAPFEPKAV